MDTNTTPTTAVTVNQVLDRFARDYMPTKLGPRTQMDYTRHIVVLRRWFGERNPDEMKPRDFADFLNIDKGKFQRIRQLAVLDRCWLLPMRGEFILTRRCGGRFTSEGFRAMWQKVMQKWMRGGGENFHFHDIRALCATRQPTPEHARRLLGHTNIAMTMRVYRRGRESVTPVGMSAAMTAQQ